MFQNFIPSAAQDFREDVNMFIQHDWAEDAAATARQANERAMERTQHFNQQEAREQREWAERMSSTAYQRVVNDMRAAGLNPMLAVSQGGASSPGGSAASGSAVPSHPASNPSYRAGASAGQLAMIDALVDKTRAEAANIRAQTPVHAVSMDKMKQEIVESNERVSKIMAETNKLNQDERTSAAQQHLFEQQKRNLQEEVEKIRAMVQNVHQDTVLKSTHGAEVAQRIKANLPEIERLLKELEAKTRELSLHGQGMTAAANASWLGAWRATIRAMTGQKD